MFISKEEIKAATGKDIDGITLSTAQLMIEAFIGRDESDVNDASDTAILGKAVLFQAVYIMGSVDTILEQAAVQSLTTSDNSAAYDLSMFAPFMSPWAVKACRKVSWAGTRSVHTGSIFQHSRASWTDRWVRT